MFNLSMMILLSAGGLAQELALEGATVLTITQGTIENGTVLIGEVFLRL